MPGFRGPERFDLAFFRYILFWKRGPDPRTEAHLRGHEGKVVRLRGPKALESRLADLVANRTGAYRRFAD